MTLSTLDGFNRDNLAGRQIGIEGTYLPRTALGIHKLGARILFWNRWLLREIATAHYRKVDGSDGSRVALGVIRIIHGGKYPLVM